ncbi:MAG: glycoside hydrolase, partial [Kiritimatiellae bacterium]|nr:glycoside hydrolase [Kiritimatiellia bacterium]
MLGDESGNVPSDERRTYPDLRGIAGSDDFAAPALDRRWQWNHNPDDSAWSLKARPGFMRLSTSGVAPSL